MNKVAKYDIDSNELLEVFTFNSAYEMYQFLVKVADMKYIENCVYNHEFPISFTNKYRYVIS